LIFFYKNFQKIGGNELNMVWELAFVNIAVESCDLFNPGQGHHPKSLKRRETINTESPFVIQNISCNLIQAPSW